ncbi:MAG: hypothetical protein JO147_05430, partial [Actinobacteria bacterium]|nr:hypothetical protein [Actinomycetota bacterium]
MSTDIDSARQRVVEADSEYTHALGALEAARPAEGEAASGVFAEAQ